MNSDELEKKMGGEFPMYCPRCAHFVEHHLRWAHDHRDADEFDTFQCCDCGCTWLVDFVANHDVSGGH